MLAIIAIAFAVLYALYCRYSGAYREGAGLVLLMMIIKSGLGALLGFALSSLLPEPARGVVIALSWSALTFCCLSIYLDRRRN